MITALMAGWFIRYGKKKMILVSDILVIISSCFCLIDDINYILIGRFIFGLAAGAFTVFVPKFINETAPTEFKGPLGAMSQFMTTVGIVIPSAFGIFIPSKSALE